jgi:hypothetical protein
MKFANYLNQLKNHLSIYTEKQRFYHFRTKLRTLIQNELNMQITKSIYNLKYLIFTAIRLEKVLFKNKRFRITTPFSDFNSYRISHFNRSRKRISNNFISFRRPVMASINNNRYIYSNISDRSQGPRKVFGGN